MQCVMLLHMHSPNSPRTGGGTMAGENQIMDMLTGKDITLAGCAICDPLPFLFS